MLGIDSPFGNGAYGLCALSYSADPSTFFNPWKASSFVAISGKSVFCPPDEL